MKQRTGEKRKGKKLITSMIRPRLEYAALVWSPRLKKEIRKVERIQRTATKLPETLRDHTYEERLEKLGLTTLEKRKERGRREEQGMTFVRAHGKHSPKSSTGRRNTPCEGMMKPV